MHQHAERNRLRARIEAHQLVQKVVAAKAGMSGSMLSKRLCGDVRLSEVEERRLDRAIDMIVKH